VNPHRKAVLMVRQSLDADSATPTWRCKVAAVTSLQYRETKGATTHEIQANPQLRRNCASRNAGGMFIWNSPATEKRSNGGRLNACPDGRIFYVGIGVCSMTRR